MDKKEFAIFHNLEETQFLVDTTYNNDTEEFELKLKFWASKINGYTIQTLYWTKDKKEDFINFFKKLKEADYCESLVKSFNK